MLKPLPKPRWKNIQVRTSTRELIYKLAALRGVSADRLLERALFEWLIAQPALRERWLETEFLPERSDGDAR